jgi:hypothetical protein
MAQRPQKSQARSIQSQQGWPLQSLLQDGKDFATVEMVEGDPIPPNNALETVLEDGKLLRDQTLAARLPLPMIPTTKPHEEAKKRADASLVHPCQ